MKSYNKCPGCGVKFQTIDENQSGFRPNENAIICKRCFRSKNYGEYSNNLSTFYNIDEIKEIKNDNVIMVIDVINPFETLISKINKNVKPENLTVLVNKIDALPKSIPHEALIDWIAELAEIKNINFGQLALVSSNKKINIDSISNFILNSEKNTSIIGYSNVGKSSIIKSLFESVGETVDNLITNSIGTTKEIIEMNFKDKLLKDYPGIVLEGSYQNIMSVDQLKQTHPSKEIKISNYQLNEFQTISIGKFARFNILDQFEKQGYQFTFSNMVDLHRSKYQEKNDKFIKYELEHNPGMRYDLIISGLGTITFKSDEQILILEIPKGVKFNLVPSLYQ